MACTNPTGVPVLGCCAGDPEPDPVIPQISIITYDHPFNGFVPEWNPNVNLCTRYRTATIEEDLWIGNAANYYTYTATWNVPKGQQGWGSSTYAVTSSSGNSGSASTTKVGLDAIPDWTVRVEGLTQSHLSYEEYWGAQCGRLSFGGTCIHHFRYKITLSNPYTVEEWQQEMFDLMQTFGTSYLTPPRATDTNIARSAYYTSSLDPAITPGLPIGASNNYQCIQQVHTTHGKIFVNGFHGSESNASPNSYPWFTVGHVGFYGSYCLTRRPSDKRATCEDIQGARPTSLIGVTPSVRSTIIAGASPYGGAVNSEYFKAYPFPVGVSCADKPQTCTTHRESTPETLPTSPLTYPLIMFYDTPSTPAGIRDQGNVSFEHVATGQRAGVGGKIAACTSCVGLETNPAP